MTDSIFQSLAAVARANQSVALVREPWIRRPFAFLGMIGSQRKWRMISEKFLAVKIATEEQLAQVSCPVGIKIASKSVAEIAVSILAQFIDQPAELVNEKRATEAGKLKCDEQS